jgi:hypothetical protein
MKCERPGDGCPNDASVSTTVSGRVGDRVVSAPLRLCASCYKQMFEQGPQSMGITIKSEKPS